MNVVGRGIAASEGVGTGELHVDVDDALEAMDGGRCVVVAFDRTTPADVPALVRAAGVITAWGDTASHAALITHEAGVPCVVGLTAMTIGREGVDIGGRSLPVGARVTVDGTTGEVGLA